MTIVPHGAPSALAWTGAELDQAVTNTDRARTRHDLALAALWQAHDIAPFTTRGRYMAAIHRHQQGLADCERRQADSGAVTMWCKWRVER